MSRISMKTIRLMSKEDLRGRIQEHRGELVKLRVDAAKGILKKESGKLKLVRRDIARMMTRMTELRKE